MRTAVASVAPRADAAPVLAPVPLWSPAFPSAELVGLAAGLLPRLPDWDGREGPRARIVVGPGVVQVGSHDPARAARSHEVRVRADRARADEVGRRLAAGDVDQVGDDVEPVEGRVRCWSARSRARMVKTLGQLDYAPLFSTGRVPAMLTLTYPGDWQTVAPDAAAAARHVRLLQLRFRRHYGVPLVGVWKREFQRRGAPHFHVHMTPPEAVGGEHFRVWVSRTWAAIVAHPDPEQRRRHALAGTGLDYAEGMRMKDPKRLAVYFSKHGAFSAKEYQNEAPAEWIAAGSVGRFWGVWGLSKALGVVEVPTAHAEAAARVLRRWSRANGYVAKREVWRSSSSRTAGGVDADGCVLDGPGGRRFRKRRVSRRVKRMRGRLGFVMVNDGPAFVSQLARYLDMVDPEGQALDVGAPVEPAPRIPLPARPALPAAVPLF